MPALEFDLRVAVALSPHPSHVDVSVDKELVTVSAGQWSGSFGNGPVVVRRPAAVGSSCRADRRPDGRVRPRPGTGLPARPHRPGRIRHADDRRAACRVRALFRPAACAR